MSKKNVPREAAELEALFQEDLQMLKDRCDAFYQGKVHEARNAAGIISKLLAESGQTSLLKQLGTKDSYKYLDSRHFNRLVNNSAKGSWPWTVVPMSIYTEKNLVTFDEWWNGQEFCLWYRDVLVTREELIGYIRNREGQHVGPTPKKIAKVRAARSGWQRQITENEDGTTTMYVGVDLTRKPLPEDSDRKEISDYELASVIAIAEELLFSVTPEPENRLRMHDEGAKRPYYLTNEQSDAAKVILRSQLEGLNEMAKTAELREGVMIKSAQQALNKTLEVEHLTMKDFDVRRGIAQLLHTQKIPWGRETEGDDIASK